MIVLFNKDWLSRWIDKSKLPTDGVENGGLWPAMGCLGGTATGGVNTRLDGKLGRRKDRCSGHQSQGSCDKYNVL